VSRFCCDATYTPPTPCNIFHKTFMRRINPSFPAATAATTIGPSCSAINSRCRTAIGDVVWRGPYCRQANIPCPWRSTDVIDNTRGHIHGVAKNPNQLVTRLQVFYVLNNASFVFIIKFFWQVQRNNWLLTLGSIKHYTLRIIFWLLRALA